MNKVKYTWLVLRALCELARYEAMMWLRGFGYIQQQLSRQSPQAMPVNCKVKHAGREVEQAICEAVLLATCLYFKPVLCLQRSVCTVRLLRRHGVVGRLAIGYRPAPFFSHAWVEVDGRIVNGSSAFQTRLRLLYTV